VNEHLTESLPSPRAANAIRNQDGVFAEAELYLLSSAGVRGDRRANILRSVDRGK
jgi:hypothetical protein